MSDLIKREDAVKAFCMNCKGQQTPCEHEATCGTMNVLRYVVSAERKGEWKDRTYGGRILHPWWESCECSQCEEWGSGAWNFCPNCGASMKGSDDETD